MKEFALVKTALLLFEGVPADVWMVVVTHATASLRIKFLQTVFHEQLAFFWVTKSALVPEFALACLIVGADFFFVIFFVILGILVLFFLCFTWPSFLGVWLGVILSIFFGVLLGIVLG